MKNRKASLAIRLRLADNLKTRRNARGYTHAGLARRAGFTESYISNVEQATVNITLANLETLARGLDCSEEDLLRINTAMSNRKAGREIANQQPSYGIGDKVTIINPQKRREDIGRVLYVCGVTAGQVQLSHDGRAWDGSPWLSVNDISHA